VSDAAGVMGVRRQMRELVDGVIEVKVHIDPRFRADFLRLFPEIDMPVALAPLQPEAAQQAIATPPEPRREKSLAERLVVDGYFRNPALWRALHEAGLYVVGEHKRFVMSLPCLWSGVTPPGLELPLAAVPAGAFTRRCEGQVCAHHARGASLPAAGEALQPDAPMKVAHWYCIPVCHAHHMGWIHASGGATRADHAALTEVAVSLMAGRAKLALKTYLGLPTLADIDQEHLREFEHDIGLRRG
jgi:hypothetical protein